MMELGRADLSADELGERTGIEEEKLEPLLALLEVAGYVERRERSLHATALVLRPEDAGLVERLVALGRTIITRWHEESYDRLAEELADLTPVRNGVPFERVYTEIWHFVFGIANRTLVEEALFADPYAAGSRHHGFLPVIWAAELVDG